MSATSKSRSGLQRLLSIGALIIIGLGVLGFLSPLPATAANNSAADVAMQVDVDTYTKLLRTFDPNGQAIVSVEADPFVRGRVVLEVSNAWHYDPKPIRLQATQSLWEGWATIHNPDEPDKARIKLVDARGNQVGGSRTLAGSLLYVDD
ncbi:hypothetical protein ACQ4M4_12790 [Leptolyngbya sp. AN02str]|uniref:hypothetical protein n=1 Tax=Leptolyngbya sp. AN02str TaxID=3423363 RepID=UPI003D315C4A